MAVASPRAQRRPGPEDCPGGMRPRVGGPPADRIGERSPDFERLADGRPTFARTLYSAGMSVAADATPIGREEREKFERDGYLVVGDAGCGESVLDGIVADLDGLFEGEYRREADGVYYSDHRIMDAWRISENVKSLALAPRIHSMLEQLYGRRPLPFQTLNFRWGTEQPAHSDAIHFNSEPAGYMCGAWVALEDIDMDCGPVVYYPGSHRLPEVTMDEIG